jgi:hypothetical protein
VQLKYYIYYDSKKKVTTFSNRMKIIFIDNINDKSFKKLRALQIDDFVARC